MGRIGRSFRLVGQSYRILMQDKELMVLPLASGAITIAVAGSFFVGFGLKPSQLEQHGPEIYLPLFLIYVAAYAIGIFFQAALVAGATERMRGGDPTVASALAAAGRRIGPILMWAIVASTVGVIIRAIHDRLGFVGRIVVSLIGAAWSLATLFVVPVLVLEERSIPESFTQSVSVFKRTWGETMVGGVGLGTAAACGWVALVASAGLLAYAGAGLFALALFGAGAIFLAVFFSALNGIYVASLYRYAIDGHATGGFDDDLLKQAFVPKHR